jgi:hypothetical protein
MVLICIALHARRDCLIDATAGALENPARRLATARMTAPLVNLDQSCPCCSRAGLKALYSVPQIPLQSNLVAHSRAQALTVPRGDLSLAACPDCGFITNTAFDPASQELTAQYEASQACSATFNTFAKSLAARWARDYLGPGKVALEIGCGRGEFVRLLSEMCGCRAIGLDPVLESSSPPDAPVRLIADRYSEKYGNLPAHLIVCRHTLEHIPDAGAFVRMIRASIGDRRETVVAIEVPDTLRILTEGAFWDLYYEHCSYFTPGSLARLFRAAGFDLLDLRREYDDQYLILEAEPAEGPTRARFNMEDDLAAVSEAVEAFPAGVERQLAHWRRVMRETIEEGKRITLWGSGSKAVGFCSTLGIGHERVDRVVDINPSKQGTFLPGTGQQIVSPTALLDDPPDVVVVMNAVYVAEIRSLLAQIGLSPQLYALD